MGLPAMRQVLRGFRDRARGVKNELAWKARRRAVARSMAAPAPLPAGDSLADSTLFFVPYAGVTPLFAQACVVARTLKERGHRVVFARCWRIFDRCPVMDMRFVPYDADADAKRESCLHCADNSLAMLDEYRLDALDLRPLIDDEMVAAVDGALARAPGDLLDFEFDGVQFGALAAIDLVLARKISDFRALSELDRAAWRQYLRSCLFGYLLVDRLCREWRIGRIVHCNDYSLLLGARSAALKHGVPCYGLAFPGHRNVDLRRYLILSNVWKPSSFKLLEQWPTCRDLSLDPERVREIGDDLLVRLRARGSHIYSPAKTLHEEGVRDRLGLSPGRRLLVAYTSSLDEVLAARLGMEVLNLPLPERPQPFSHQIQWLHELIDYVETSDDLQLVVRIHPREGANKRESVVSQHLARLRKEFSGTYAHCRFVWPEDAVSSYDLGEAAELVLISWSTIGLELARLGAPILVAFSGRDVAIPRDDFLEWAATPREYFVKLRELLDRPVTLEQVAHAFRWYDLYTLGTTVDFGDVVPRSDFATLPPFRVSNEAEMVERIIIEGEDVCDLNIERLKKRQHAGSAEEEARELRRQLRRLVHFLATGEDSPDDQPLTLRRDGGTAAEPPTIASAAGRRPREIHIDGLRVEYRDGDRMYCHESPMSARLAALCATETVGPASPPGRGS
jgi:hypothetical protein